VTDEESRKQTYLRSVCRDAQRTSSVDGSCSDPAVYAGFTNSPQDFLFSVAKLFGNNPTLARDLANAIVDWSNGPAGNRGLFCKYMNGDDTLVLHICWALGGGQADPRRLTGQMWTIPH
jgi:hypothetical protein